MNADFETAAWARHHHRLTAMINKVLATIDVSLAALNRYEFAAPWRHERPQRRQA